MRLAAVDLWEPRRSAAVQWYSRVPSSAALAMETLMRRVPLYRLSNCFKRIRIGSFNGRYHHSKLGNSMSFPKEFLDCLPQLPLAPRYPCPFIMAADMETYILPLYRIGWGISHVSNHPSNSTTTRPATQLSKEVILPSDMAKTFAADIMGTIVEQENVKVPLCQTGSWLMT